MDLVILTGGEPFLKNDLVDIVREYHRITDNFAIPTNGKDTVVIMHKVGEILKMKNVRLNIGISLDGLGSSHDVIRGEPGLWEKAVNTIRELKTTQAKHKNLGISIQILILPENIKEIIRLAQYIQEEIKISVDLELRRQSPYNDISWSDSILIRELAGMKPGLRQIYKKNSLLQPEKSRFYYWSWRKLLQEMDSRIRMRCLAGKVIGVLYPSGEVAICEQKKPFANLSAFGLDFKKLWHSEAAEVARRGARGCSCSHGCFIYQSLDFDLLRKALALRQKIS